jgi:hypothetical protein
LYNLFAWVAAAMLLLTELENPVVSGFYKDFAPTALPATSSIPKMVGQRVFVRDIGFKDGFELRPGRREFREFKRAPFLEARKMRSRCCGTTLCASMMAVCRWYRSRRVASNEISEARQRRQFPMKAFARTVQKSSPESRSRERKTAENGSIARNDARIGFGMSLALRLTAVLNQCGLPAVSAASFFKAPAGGSTSSAGVFFFFAGFWIGRGITCIAAQ